LLAGRVVARLADLLPALEAAAPRADRKRPPVDVHVAAFTAARADTTLLSDIGHLDGFATPAERLSVLRLFARLQARLHSAPLPALAGWLLDSGLIDLHQWRNLQTRQAVGKRLAEAAAAGQIPSMLHLAQDEAAHGADRAGAVQAAARAGQIEQELAALLTGGAKRRLDATRLGHEIAAALGLLAMLGAAVALGMMV
jgi:hypothetical protein